MAAMRFEQVQRFILAQKYFGVRGTLTVKPFIFSTGYMCLFHAPGVLQT